jgi:hypothetical protein
MAEHRPERVFVLDEEDWRIGRGAGTGGHEWKAAAAATATAKTDDVPFDRVLG